MSRSDVIAPPASARRNIPAFARHFMEPFGGFGPDFERLFENFPTRIAPLLRSTLPEAVTAPALEMTEAEGAYKLAAELPGMKADDIEISVEDGVLTIAGEKKDEREEKDKTFFFSERSYGAFARRIQLPADASADKISAECKDGLLTITLPKDEKAVERKRRIAVHGH